MKDFEGLTNGLCEPLHLMVERVLPNVVVKLLEIPSLLGCRMAAEMLKGTFEVMSDFSEFFSVTSLESDFDFSTVLFGVLKQDGDQFDQ
jgi:hypothetical protein